jgi:phage gpG-like protein
MSKFRFDLKAENFKLNKSVLLEMMANNCVNHFKIVNFDAEGFVDRTVTKWKPRKNNSDPGRRLNVKTGRLRQSISIISRSIDSRTVGSNVPYAGFVNVSREFMGKSAVLTAKNQELINSFVKKSL